MFAIGDVTKGQELAHRAMAQAHVVGDVLLGGQAVFDPACIPAVVFSDPEVIQVGPSLEEAIAMGWNAKAVSRSFRGSGRAATIGATTGHLTLVFDADGGALLGVQGVGVGIADSRAKPRPPSKCPRPCRTFRRSFTHILCSTNSLLTPLEEPVKSSVPRRKEKIMASLAERMQSGETLVGTLHDLEDPNLIELVARSGVDFVVFCFEHGLKNEARIGELIRAAEVAGVPAMRPRRPSRDLWPREVPRCWGSWADGLACNRQSSSRRGGQLVQLPSFGGQRCRIHPRLGVPIWPGWRFARKMKANEDLVLIGIIEDPVALDNLDEILSVPGYTAFIAGPGDLALSMGEETHLAPKVAAAVSKISDAVKSSKSHALMAYSAGPETVKPLQEMGATILMLAHDSYVIRDT